MDKWSNTLPKKCLGGALAGPNARQGEFSSSKQLNTTALNIDIVRPGNKVQATSTNNSKNLNGGQNQTFWQTSIEDQRPKLIILINNIEIERTVNTGAYVIIISPKSWPVDWPLQEVDIQFEGVRTSSQIKQSTRWLNYTGPEGQIGKLRL